MRLDTQVRYDLGMRLEGINDDFGDSPTYDASEHFAGKGHDQGDTLYKIGSTYHFMCTELPEVNAQQIGYWDLN